MLLVCARKPFVKLQPPRLQEHLPNAFGWNAIVFRKTSSSLRRRKHLRTQQTVCCTECGERRPFLFTLETLYVLAMLIPFCEGLWNQELMLHGREASWLRRAAVWWGLAVVTLRTERASLNFRHILPPSNRSLCSMTDSFLSFIFWWKWTSEMVEGQGTIFLFPVYHFHLPYAPWFLCSHFFHFFLKFWF